MIFLVNPPNPPGAVSNKDMMGGLGQLYDKGGPKVPPIDLPYIAACLKEEHIPFHVIDCLGLDYDTKILVKEIQHFSGGQKATVAIRTSLPTYNFDMATADRIKKETSARIVIFGPYVSLNPDEILKKDFVTAIVLGEPEYAFADISTKGLKATKGIWLKDEKGKIVRNNPREALEDLDQLPIPEWESMPYKAYILPPPQFPDNNPFLPVLTSRGCPFTCGYCPYPLIQGSKWRKRSAENVLFELTHIVTDLGITNILFRDPEFTLDRKRILQICQKILDKKLKFSWRCETRMDTLDEELIKKMADAGCMGMNLGIESSSEETLRRMDRRAADPEHCTKILTLCEALNIHTFCFFIIGLPGEKKKDILKTVRMAKAYDCSQIQFTYAIPYPGTPMFRWAEENGFILDQKLSDLSGYVPVMRNEHLTVKRIQRIHHYAVRSVQMRKSSKEKRIRQSGFVQRGKELAKETLLWVEKWWI